MNSISGNNDQQLKFLFARLREHLEQQKEQREMSMMAESESSSTESSDESEDSSHCSFKNTINRCCAQTSCTDDKKPSSTPQDVNSKEVRSPAPISLPFVTFKEDDCDEAEKRARAKRIEVIMRLSAEAKAKEAERKRVANIQPLSWDKPTFDYPSNASSTSPVAAATAAAPDAPKAPSPTLGKRKSRQEDFSRNAHSTYFASSRISTEDEIQALVDFANEYFPSGKRSRSTDKEGGDDEKS